MLQAVVLVLNYNFKELALENHKSRYQKMVLLKGNAGQSKSSLGKVPIEILPGKRHITWVLAVLRFSAEFQMEPLGPNVIYYYTSQ